MHMRLHATLGLAAALAAFRIDPAPPPPPSPTAAEIVQRFIAARGGLARIKAVRSLVLRAPGRFMARARPYYWKVGDNEYAEGSDGAPWEYLGDPGLVLRTSDAPAAAARHTGYFDDPLVSSLEPGFALERLPDEPIGGRPAYGLRATYPDGFQMDLFVDRESWLVIASRKVAPVHAFGKGIATETRISDYRPVNGALFPMTFREFVIASGKPLEDMSGTWTSVEANTDLPPGYFSPPTAGATPQARMLNAVFAARHVATDAFGWYRYFKDDPATAAVDTEAGLEFVAYQCLKNGAVPAGLLLLEENAREHPRSAKAHFGLGRAYRAAGREAEAQARFREALALDPSFTRARQALDEAPVPH